METRSISCHKTGAAIVAWKRMGGLTARRVKDRMNGTAREIAGFFNSVNSENCPLKPDFHVVAFPVEWRTALEGVCPSGTLKDTE
jgi:hypothetical protein